jgi:peptidoglycan/xylan/chitin deacetylase (PgdA/CDA1 family)
VILLYHGIPKDSDGNFAIDGAAFEQQIIFLKQHFKIVPADRLWDRREAHENIRVMLTFDDSFRNHAEVAAPILRKHDVPATFFICSRHSISGKYLWFSYLRALEKHFPDDSLCFRSDRFNMSPDQRNASLRRLSDLLLGLKPHPSAMYQAIETELPRLESFVSPEHLADSYAGMTAEQVSQLAKDSLFSFGVHTVDHPLLTKCDPDEVYRQILGNKTWIERATNRRCDFIAYPEGAYNAKVVEQCRDFGFTHGHALVPILNTDVEYEVPRMGIYSVSLDVLGFKVQWGNLLRAMKMKVG